MGCKMFKFSGIAPPAVVPFGEDGKIDEGKYKEILDWLIGQGVHAIVAGGSTGEVVYLSEEERIEVLELTVDHVDGRVPVVAGTGCPGTANTVGLTSEAEKLGAEAALVVTPFYYPLSGEELEEHYRKILREVDLPLILYHVPKFTEVEFKPRTIEKLSSEEKVLGVKESSGDLGSIQKTIYLTEGRDFGVICGSGNLLSNVLGCGGVGGILALANLLPEKCGRIYELCSEGRWEEGRRVNFELMEMNRLITSRFGVPGLKAAMKIRGLPAGHTRAPLSEVSKGEEEEIRKELERVLKV